MGHIVKATGSRDGRIVLPHADEAKELFAPHLPCDEEQLRKVYLRLALKYHPDKWPQRHRGQATALFQAIGAVYEALLRPFGRRLVRRVRSPVAAAAELGDLEELGRLIRDSPQSACEADENGTYPLMFAARGGSVEAVQMLLACGADLHARTPLGWSVLLFAALGDRYDLVRWLVARGARAAPHELVLAAYTGSLQGLKALCELFEGRVADLRTDASGTEGGAGRTLLHVVCEGMCSLRRDRPDAYVGCLDLLLGLGVPVDVVEPGSGRTCLHTFVGNGEWQEHGFEDSPAHMVVLERLLEHGASPSLQDGEGQSALSLAAVFGLHRVSGVLQDFCREGFPEGRGRL